MSAPVGRPTYQHGFDERAGDRDALLLAAGELGRMMVRAIGKADFREPRESTLPAFFLRGIAVKERQLDVLDGRGTREQIEVLEDESEAAVAYRRQRVAGKLGNLFAREEVLSAGRRARQRAGS